MAATHKTGRRKRDPYRASQIAPKQPVQPVRCDCGHAGLMHRDDGRCLNRICDCEAYREQPWP